MAFLRAEKKASGTYLRIVQSYKQDGKPKHKTLYSLGKVEDYAVGQLERIAQKLLELSGKSFEELVTYELHELGRYNYGFPLLVNYLWRSFNLKPFFKKHLTKRKIEFDVENVIRLLLCERLSEPVSKHCSWKRQTDYIGFEQQELHHLYRTIDVMDDLSDKLQKYLYHQQRNLFNQQLDLVFYDVTTLYFDSQQETQEDELRKKGYSKDGKSHKLQVVLGLVVDKMRNPIAYQLYQGNQYEGHTFNDSITRLKKDFHINKVIVVTDRGMMSKKNLAAISQQKYDFIIGERLKNLPQSIINELIDTTKHQPLPTSKEDTFTFHQCYHEGKRIICTFSAKRAAKDAHERNRLIEKANYYIAHPDQLKQKNKQGSKRYINYLDNERIDLDEDKIKEDEKFDGFLTIATNRTDLAAEQVIEQYTNLFEVEHAFRTLKSVLEIRPMYHWTDKRIRGHVALCFLSYLFLNTLTKSLKWSETKLSTVLDKMQVSEVKQSHKEEAFFLRSKIDEDTKQLIAKFGLVVPKDTTSKVLVNQILTI